MRVLGVSASSRAWGNTDILVRHVLRSAEGEGAETQFLRLADFDIGSCTGCMSCIFKNRDCVIDDGLHDIVEAMRWSDAVVIGSPTYVLGAAGVINTLRERLSRFGTVCCDFRGKPAIAIAAAGVPGWEPFALPQISLTFLALGMPIVDQFVGYGQGPGEVFWDSESLARAEACGLALARGGTVYVGPPGTCPVCHFDLVKVESDGSGHCQLCDLPGSWTRDEEELRFQPRIGAQPRWSEDNLKLHLQERLLPSGSRFKSRVSEIRAKVHALKGPEHGSRRHFSDGQRSSL